MIDDKKGTVSARFARLHEERRYATTSVSMHHLGGILLGHLRVHWPDLPEDAVFLGAYPEMQSDCLRVRWMHESFTPHSPGMMIEDLGMTATMDATVNIVDGDGRWLRIEPASVTEDADH